MKATRAAKLEWLTGKAAKLEPKTTYTYGADCKTSDFDSDAITLRSLCDYALIFASRFHRERRHILHFCGSWFAREKEFLAVFDMATEGKHCSMVYINRQDSLLETYMSWKSDEIGDFRLGFPVV